MIDETGYPKSLLKNICRKKEVDRDVVRFKYNSNGVRQVIGSWRNKISFPEKEVLRECSEMMESNEAIAEASKISRQRLLRFDVAIAGRAVLRR